MRVESYDHEIRAGCERSEVTLYNLHELTWPSSSAIFWLNTCKLVHATGRRPTTALSKSSQTHKINEVKKKKRNQSKTVRLRRKSLKATDTGKSLSFDIYSCTMGPVRIRHSSHDFGWQSSHSVDRAGWQAKMDSIEIWMPWRDAHWPR